MSDNKTLKTVADAYRAMTNSSNPVNEETEADREHRRSFGVAAPPGTPAHLRNGRPFPGWAPTAEVTTKALTASVVARKSRDSKDHAAAHKAHKEAEKDAIADGDIHRARMHSDSAAYHEGRM